MSKRVRASIWLTLVLLFLYAPILILAVPISFLAVPILISALTLPPRARNLRMVRSLMCVETGRFHLVLSC